EDALWLRFTILDERLFQVFVQRFLMGADRPTLRLSQVQFGIAEVLTTPGSHPWAGYTSARALLDGQRETARAETGLDTSLALEFASPTAFSLGGDGGKRMEV